MATGKEDTNSMSSNKSGVSDEDVRKESSQIAKQATKAQKKATELMKAAAAAGDPEERQKLMEQALEQQIQSKSLGKTAKYLRSGAFQGMAVGAGLGIAPGASLGAISGTLVGGVSSIALGGLGAGIGAATGSLHGPFWDIGEGMTKGIQKMTEDLPGWKATDTQKEQLEKMISQINEQNAPGPDELENWTNESSSERQKETVENGMPATPSLPSTSSLVQSGKSSALEKEEDASKNAVEEQSAKKELQQRQSVKEDAREENLNANGDEQNHAPSDTCKTPRSIQEQQHQGSWSIYKDAAVQTENSRKKPRKLQTKFDDCDARLDKSINNKRKPRKLEKR